MFPIGIHDLEKLAAMQMLNQLQLNLPVHIVGKHGWSSQDIEERFFVGSGVRCVRARGRRLGGVGIIGTAMMMVAAGFANSASLKVGLQTGKSLLRAGKITVLQCADQAFVIRIRLGVAAKRLTGRSLRIALQILLECRQRALGGRKISGLESAANGAKILKDLRHIVLIRRLVRVGGRRYTRYGAHTFILFQCVFGWGLAILPPALVSDGI